MGLGQRPVIACAVELVRASGRWQARLDGVSAGALPALRPSGFVAARVAPIAASTSVRVELHAGAARLELHCPLAHTRELATLLRELSR